MSTPITCPGAPLIKARTGAKVAIGEHVREVQTIFRPIFGADDMKADGSDFDRLLKDGERFEAGGLDIEVMHTPGHTPACVSYRIGDAVFVGDTMFMPDYGTARTDFPGGCARQLYRSIRRLLSLPPETRLFMCHDYKAPGRESFAWETTVAEERRSNQHVHDGVGEDEFVAMREERDSDLGDAEAPHSLDPGQHARGTLPASRRGRRPLLADSGEAQGRRRPRGGQLIGRSRYHWVRIYLVPRRTFIP